jgi:hypothetical protein
MSRFSWFGEKTTGNVVKDEELAALEERLPENSATKTQKGLHDLAERADPVSAARGRAVMPLLEIAIPFLVEGGLAFADWLWTEARTAYLLGRMGGEGLEVEAGEAGRLAHQGRLVAEAERGGVSEWEAAALQVVRQGNCFLAGTTFRTLEGEKAIECFRPGDLLLSRPEHDPEGPVEVKTVQEVFVGVAPVLEVVVNGRVIGTTEGHPFYVRGVGWRCAGELRPGDELSSHDGAWIEVQAVRATGKVATVYNLRVADNHTYFVGSTEWGFSVWAHNTCGYLTYLDALGLQNTAEAWEAYKQAVGEAADLLKNSDSLRSAQSRWGLRWGSKIASGADRSQLGAAIFRDAQNFIQDETTLVRSYRPRGSMVGLPRDPEVLAGQKLGRGGSPTILGDNLEAAGAKRLPNSEAHHIVAWDDLRAAEARQILKTAGVDIDEAANGVFLADSSENARPPARYHSEVHTDKYYREVTRRLRAAPAGKVREALQGMAQELLKGTFPI